MKNNQLSELPKPLSPLEWLTVLALLVAIVVFWQIAIPFLSLLWLISTRFGRLLIAAATLGFWIS